MFTDGPDVKSCMFPRSSVRHVGETAVVVAAELLPGMEGVLFHLWQGFSAPAPLTFGLDSPLLWRTVLYIAGCSAASPASAP